MSSLGRPRVLVLCLPDIDRPIGGVKQLYRHVEHLCSLGWDAAMVSEFSGFRPSWFDSTAPSISLREAFDRGDFDFSNTLIMLPETYLGVDLTSFYGFDLSDFARVIFNQNAYYTYGDFSSDPARSLLDFYEDSSVLQILSVSENTHDFLSRNLNISDSLLSRIVNAIEPIFHYGQSKQNFMHWMPRKNTDHVLAIINGMKRSDLRNSLGWQGEPLENLSHLQIAERLNRSRLFLSFGHPEGFGLPIAEAMAAGCWVVGYSGGGGRELFRFGGGHEVEFGDWVGFLNGVQDAFNRFASNPRETELRLQRQSLAIQTLYSHAQEQASIAAAWERISYNFHQWR